MPAGRFNLPAFCFPEFLCGAMPRRPNYGLSRSDVKRAKQARLDEKLRAQEEAVAQRRAARESVPPDASPDAPPIKENDPQ